MPDLLARARAFHDADFDPDTRAELAACIDATERGEPGALADLEDRFRGRLEFGTAGLRGVLGAGETRMNRAVVVRTTAGLAMYLKAAGLDGRGVVLGRDGRRGSAAFADDAAAVLAAAGIRVWLFPDVVPTPLVSYAVRTLGAGAGVMVTASHNPPEYNGYKAYAANSAQIVPPVDTDIANAIAKAPAARVVPRMDLDEARALGLVREPDPKVLEGYYEAVLALSRRNEGRADLRVVYTPMHGVGDRYVHEVMRRFGFGRVVSVPEQAAPDGEFPTVRFPNPEEPGALDLAVALAKKEQAHVLLANDPDADRLAVAVPDGDRWVQLSGNEVGVLLAHYLLTDDPSPAEHRLAVTTIVSSPLLGLMCKALGVRYAETLTGFKWIANTAMHLEQAHRCAFVMGYEEALGYSVGTVARDKDGVSAVAIFAEFVASLRARGETVLGRLEAIYRRFGLVVSRQHNVTRKGLEGAAAIKAQMGVMRKSPPAAFGTEKVLAVRDYLDTAATGLPSSDVLTFDLGGGTRVTMRPSGTEPKVKYYFDVVEPLQEGEPFADGRSRATARLDALEKEFVQVAKAALG
ncbi:MAG: phospho-sugar mutase [Myxococcales bacterium]|nr:phospho-sugar mutase [Myxococcales bacterium]